MRFLIHGLKSLVRRPAKTGMLLVILFVVFNLIFTGFIIQNSIARSKDYIRNQLGSAVEYKMDYTAFIAANKPSNTGERPSMTSVPALSKKVAEKIAANHYVESCYITESANANSDTIDPADTQSSSTGFQRNFSDFNFSGTNNVKNLDFVLGNVKLTSGRTLSADDLSSGSNVVIISEDLATENSLLVGDTISLSKASTPMQQAAGQGGGDQGGQNGQGGSTSTTSTTSTAESVSYQVIGIYKAVEEDFDVNTIFTSNTVIDKLNDTADSDETNGSIVFLLDDPDHIEAFKEEASPYLTSEYHILYSDDSEYTSLTKPLDLLSFITSILIWVVFVAGAAIIMALVTIFVRDRKFEIGLLMSCGEARLKIIAQFVFEIMLIAFVAFGISVASSSVVSKGVSSWIVENQLLSSTSLIGSTSTDTSTIDMPGGGMQRMGESSVSLYGAVDMESVSSAFDVSINSTVLGELMLASFVMILFGSSIPLVIIMRYKPKRIMQDD